MQRSYEPLKEVFESSVKASRSKKIDLPKKVIEVLRCQILRTYEKHANTA